MRKKIFGIACAAFCVLGVNFAASAAPPAVSVDQCLALRQQKGQADPVVIDLCKCVELREQWRVTDPVVVNLFGQFPKGVGLADAISQLLFNYPALAADVAFYAATSGSRAQQVAAGIGIGRAVAAYTSLGNYAIAGSIARAAFCGGNQTIISNAIVASAGAISPNGDYNPPPPPQQAPPPHSGQPTCPTTVSPTRPCI